MILYTMLPEEMIFPQQEESYQNQQTIEISGGQLLVEPISANSYKIVRLISSDASLYLNENYSPGKIIELKPNLE